MTQQNKPVLIPFFLVVLVILFFLFLLSQEVKYEKLCAQYYNHTYGKPSVLKHTDEVVICDTGRYTYHVYYDQEDLVK